MKKLFFILIILLLAAGIAGIYGYRVIFGANVLVNKEAKDIYVPTGSDYNAVKSILEKEEIVENITTFDWVAQRMKYSSSKIPVGKFTIQPDWSNYDLISFLRTGKQTPVKITFNNVRRIDELSGRIASYLEMDSIELLDYLKSSEALQMAKTNEENIITRFLPNTYEVYWNITKERLLERMIKENDKFWSENNRDAKASNIGLTREEVYTLASIVEKESLRKDEQPRIAGVYINRLERGMLLQADPTVVFAVGDFGIQRVLNKHLEINSPYNTYQNVGLPPGPIYMPSLSAIDAVLNFEEHSYLYFCAKPESNGGHSFATNLTQHNANARIYHNWLSRQGIR